MTAQSSAHSPDNALALIDLLRRQRDLYHQLKALSDQQATLIARGGAEELLGLLGRRQRLVEALTELSEKLGEVRRDLPDLRSALGPDQQRQVRVLTEEVDAMLRQIVAQDDRDRQQLQAAQQRLGGQIEQVNRGGAARDAYRTASTAASRFTDRQG